MEPVKAEEGLRVQMNLGAVRGRDEEREFTVGPGCGGRDGFWVCTTHGQSFAHNFAKDSHCSRGEHVLAWFCGEHDALEVP